MSAVAAPASAVTTQARRSPYQGLVPYRETDAEWFFGRDDWCDVVGDNLRAYRLTVLYGRSGVGKSSLLRAGVMRKLTDEARENVTAFGTPRLLPVRFAAWSLDDPIVALKETVAGAARGLSPELAAEVVAESGLVAALEHWPTLVDGPLLLVLDQLEEVFVYHRRTQGFVLREIGELLRARDPAIHLLLSIRDDALARLDGFEGRVDGLLDHRLELTHLDRVAAREAIVKPVERWNEVVATPAAEVEVEPELVEAVLDQVTAGRVAMVGADVGGRAGRDDAPARDAIEAPFLQLVLDRLWTEEQSTRKAQGTGGPLTLRLHTLDRLGGAERIVRTHLDTVLRELPPRERDDAGRTFRYLVSPSGTKIAQRLPDLAEYAQLPDERVESLVNRLTGEVRVLRGAGDGRYEIYHDALVGPILDWRRRWEEGQRRRRERRRLIVAAGIVAALAAITGVIAILAVQASRQHHKALLGESRAVAAQARATLETDPATGLRLALRAAEISLTNETEATLRAALVANLPYRTFAHPARGGRRGVVTAATFSPDGKSILTATRTAPRGSSSEVRLQSAATGKLIWRRTDAGVVRGAAFSPDGRLVVTVGDRGVGRMLDAVTGKERHTLPGSPPGWDIRKAGVSFAADGSHVVTADSRGTAEIWDRNGHLVRQLREHAGVLIVSAALSPDGSRVVTASDNGVAQIWDVAAKRRPLALTTGTSNGGVANKVWDASFSPDGRRVVTAHDDGTVRVWNAANGRSVQTLTGLNGTVWAASFSPDGRLVLAASEDATARIWDASTGRTLRVLSGHRGAVHAAAFSRSGSLIVTGADDGTARVWDLSGIPSLRILSARRQVEMFRPPRAVVVVAAKEGAVRAWDRSTGRSRTYRVGGEVLGVASSPDRKHFATAMADGTVGIWDLATGRSLFGPLRGHSAPVKSVAYSPDGSSIVTASYDRTARIWDARTGIALQTLWGHKDVLWRAAFTPDGRRIVTTSRDGSTRIWACGACRFARAELLREARARLSGS